MFVSQMGKTDFRLPKQIYNSIRILAWFDWGTQSKIGPLCGLVRGNLQFPSILGLFSEPKISWFDFLVDLKVQSKRRDKKMPRSDVYEIYEVKICLNINSKLDKESRRCDDIAFPYKILVNLQDCNSKIRHKIWIVMVGGGAPSLQIG